MTPSIATQSNTRRSLVEIRACDRENNSASFVMETEGPSLAELGVKRLLIENAAWISNRTGSQVSRRLKDYSLAPDIAQETCVRLLRAMPSFKHVAQFRAYFLIAMRSVMNSRRHSAQSVILTPSSESPTELEDRTPDKYLLARTAALSECLSKLCEHDRHILRLRYWHGFSCEQIAESLDISPNAVATQSHRARARLRAIILEYEAC